jgi:tetratricopeptide (TPR) repeat protein
VTAKAYAEHLAQGDFTERAIKAYGEALQRTPKLEKALLGRAALRLKTGEPQQALVDGDQALRAGLFAHSVKGDAYLQLADYDRAIAEYAAAQRIDADVARAYLGRSQQRRTAGETAAADADLQQARLLDPTLPR